VGFGALCRLGDSLVSPSQALDAGPGEVQGMVILQGCSTQVTMAAVNFGGIPILPLAM
jgi:hypothetical protein